MNKKFIQSDKLWQRCEWYLSPCVFIPKEIKQKFWKNGQPDGS